MKTKYLQYTSSDRTELDAVTIAPVMPYTQGGSMTISSANTDYSLFYVNSGIYNVVCRFKAANYEWRAVFLVAANSQNGTVTRLVENKYETAGSIAYTATWKDGKFTLNFSSLAKSVTLVWRALLLL